MNKITKAFLGITAAVATVTAISPESKARSLHGTCTFERNGRVELRQGCIMSELPNGKPGLQVTWADGAMDHYTTTHWNGSHARTYDGLGYVWYVEWRTNGAILVHSDGSRRVVITPE